MIRATFAKSVGKSRFMAIISAIALPTYQNYIQSTYFDQAVLDAKEINRGDDRRS